MFKRMLITVRSDQAEGVRELSRSLDIPVTHLIRDLLDGLLYSGSVVLPCERGLNGLVASGSVLLVQVGR